ncbi:cytoplasmic protein [Rhizobium sp.]|uniref:cytoplasmic protein n=1 Tax=Rhizobium sp. TaxID=391 RepID=UPI002F0F0201
MIKERQDIVDAYHHSIRNRAELKLSKMSGCFHCLEVFPVAEIWEWIRETREEDELLTAMCPRCGIDAVIGDASGYAIADVQFLERMRSRWFDI